MSLEMTLWIVVGLGLVIAEMFVLNLVLLFFGISAFVVALAKSLGLDSLTLEILLFAMAGLGGLFLFRKKLKQSLMSRKELAIDLNSPVVVSVDMAPHEAASIVYQGSTWTAVNGSEVPLRKGTTAYIHGTDGVKLIIKANAVSR